MHRLDCLGTIRALYYIAGVALALTGASVVQATGGACSTPTCPDRDASGVAKRWHRTADVSERFNHVR